MSRSCTPENSVLIAETASRVVEPGGGQHRNCSVFGPDVEVMPTYDKNLERHLLMEVIVSHCNKSA